MMIYRAQQEEVMNEPKGCSSLNLDRTIVGDIVVALDWIDDRLGQTKREETLSVYTLGQGEREATRAIGRTFWMGDGWVWVVGLWVRQL